MNLSPTFADLITEAHRDVQAHRTTLGLQPYDFSKANPARAPKHWQRRIVTKWLYSGNHVSRKTAKNPMF